MTQRKLAILVLLPSTLITALAIVLATVLLVRQTLAPPPFAYLDTSGARSASRVTTYQPEHAALCPSDTLRATVIGFDVTEVPVVISNQIAIRNLATDRVVPGTLMSLNPPVPYSLPAHLRSIPVAVVLPATIVPGDYLFVFVASATGRQDNAFHVYFHVRNDCARNR